MDGIIGDMSYMKCRKCGELVYHHGGRGRPRTYCSNQCRARQRTVLRRNQGDRSTPGPVVSELTLIEKYHLIQVQNDAETEVFEVLPTAEYEPSMALRSAEIGLDDARNLVFRWIRAVPHNQRGHVMTLLEAIACYETAVFTELAELTAHDE